VRGFALAPLCAVTVTVAVAGCGGHSATKQDVIARGNAICESALRDIRAAAPAGASGSLNALSGYLRQVLPIVEKEISDLRALPRPPQDRPLLDRYLAAMNGSRAQYSALASAARHRDSAAVAQALAALRVNPAPQLARRYGLVACAVPGATRAQ
jgi:hypothetical protein